MDNKSVKRQLIISFIFYFAAVLSFLGAIILNFSGTGIILFIFAIILVGFAIKINVNADSQRIKILKESGTKIGADIKYISVAVSRKFDRYGGGRYSHEFKIICEGKDTITGDTKEYVSSGFGVQPEIQIPYSSKVELYISPSDPNDYYVELPKIPTRLPDNFQGSLNRDVTYYRSYDGVNYEKIEDPS
jgi:hypothetical protein